MQLRFDLLTALGLIKYLLNDFKAFTFVQQRNDSFSELQSGKVRVDSRHLLQDEVQDLHRLPGLLLQLYPQVVADQPHERGVLRSPEEAKVLFEFRFLFNHISGCVGGLIDVIGCDDGVGV